LRAGEDDDEEDHKSPGVFRSAAYDGGGEDAMNDGEPFAVFDCSLARYAIGRSCSNLRELLEALHIVPDMVIEHHMMRCALDDHFELYEFPNDLARWCWQALDDRVLGEQLGLVDPYAHETISSLRAVLTNTIEERLWGAERVPWCRPGFELHLVGSRLVAYDTGERLQTPAALAQALPRLSLRSLFYHMHEARRRRPDQTDDFSAWLEAYGAQELAKKLRAIDFHFLNLKQVRQAITEIFEEYLLEPAVLKVSA
jgi:hypothetical protein